MQPYTNMKRPEGKVFGPHSSQAKRRVDLSESAADNQARPPTGPAAASANPPGPNTAASAYY